MSMYETGSSPRQYPHQVETARHEDGVVLQPFPTNVSTEAHRFPLECPHRMKNGAWLGAGVGFFTLTFIKMVDTSPLSPSKEGRISQICVLSSCAGDVI